MPPPGEGRASMVMAMVVWTASSSTAATASPDLGWEWGKRLTTTPICEVAPAGGKLGTTIGPGRLLERHRRPRCRRHRSRRRRRPRKIAPPWKPRRDLAAAAVAETAPRWNERRGATATQKARLRREQQLRRHRKSGPSRGRSGSPPPLWPPWKPLFPAVEVGGDAATEMAVGERGMRGLARLLRRRFPRRDQARGR